MSGVLLVAAGLAAGFGLGWALATRRARRVSAELQWDGPRTVVVPGIGPMTMEPTLESLLRLLVDEAASQVEVLCAVALREQDGGPIRIRALSSGGDQRLVGKEVEVDSLAGRIVTEGQPLVDEDRGRDLGAPLGDRRRPLAGGAGVPIVAGPWSFGALMAFGRPPEGTSGAVARLTPLAAAFAPLLLPALEVDIERRRSRTDPLTELPNRRAFDQAMARLGSAPRALVALDIDHFKQVNDEHGHAMGDAALRHLARALRESIREGDTVARIGGEEFAILLPGGDLALGVAVAERVRDHLKRCPFAAAGGQDRHITVSCGVAASPEPVGSPANLMTSADSALYQAKNEGRDRVVEVRHRGVPEGVRPAAGAVASPGRPA